tara:strand:+ start:6869 stop:7423 length:555 start_codon:yes stop_codon:yes gene_type:complete
MTLKLEHIIILGMFLYILFLSMCSDPEVITETKIENFSDTTIIRDTVIKEIVKNHYHVKPSSVDTVFLTPEYVASLDSFFFKINDTILNADITVFSESTPLINFKYKVKKFELKEKIVIKDSTIYEPLKNHFFLGAQIGGNQNSFIFAPKIEMLSKKDYLYSVGYDLLNKSVLIGLSKKISFKR